MQSLPDAAARMRHVLICGGGLAAQMTAAAFARQLPADIRISRLDPGRGHEGDLFYGTVAAPSAYAFNLAAGVDEPALILGSDTAFSWGTRYRDWGGQSWTQCFALPFPVVDGVLFHQYLAASGIGGIEPYLIAARAAARGAFAHPPRGPGETGQQPLARAEYGYQLDPAAYARLFAAAIPAGRVEAIAGGLAEVAIQHEDIAEIRLADGRCLTADLYVDCTGPDAMLLSRLIPDVNGERRIAIAAGDVAGPADRPLRTITPTAAGWQSDTPLHGRTLRLTAFDPDVAPADDSLDRSATAMPGARRAAWAGNCVGIGHAAGVTEPVTPAPLMLLERDIERLLSLIPDTRDAAVERREYNRRFADDHHHAALFNRTLFAADDLPDTGFWRSARAAPLPETLARKIDMFEDRGVLVAYDLEPFHPEDWTILHLGMGRAPVRHDRLADRAPPARVQQFLAGMQRDIEKVVAAMPDARAYRTQLEPYLRRTHR